MKKLLYCLPIFLTSILFSQSSEYDQYFMVEDFPDAKLPKGAISVGFLISFEDQPAAWGLIDKNENKKVIQELGDEFWGPMSADVYAYYTNNDTIIFSFRHSWKATITDLYYHFDGHLISFIKEDTYDHSWEMVDSAELALKEGRISDAVDYYHGVEYPMSYICEGCVAFDLVKRANEIGLVAFKEERYQDACDYVEAAFRYYQWEYFLESETENSFHEALDNSYSLEYKDSFGLFLGNYGYFLYKSGNLEKSIEFNAKVNTWYPKLSGPYLQKADALYDLGKSEEAKAPYKMYMALMKEKGMTKSIPKRVKERAK